MNMNIIKNKQIKHSNKITFNKPTIIPKISNINYSPSYKEWRNSIYSYNSMYNRLIICRNELVDSLLKDYLNMKFVSWEDLKVKRRYVRTTRKLAKKTYSSKPEIKHTNNKLVIILHLFNKKSNVILSTITNYTINLLNLLNKYKNIKLYDTINELSNNKSIINLDSNKLKKRYIKWYKRLESIKLLYNSMNNPFMSTKYKSLKLMYYGILEEDLVYKHVKDLLYVNQSFLLESLKTKNFFFKFEHLGLIGLISKIYDKNVEIDIINNKSIYMSSDLLSNAIWFKLKDRNKRILRIFRYILAMVKLPPRYMLLNKDNKEKMTKENIMRLLDNKSISGIRLQGSGRLTQRLTAQRSLSKMKYKGSLRNLNSSYKGLSSFILRGSSRSNSQYTLTQGKTRNGSFGLKCWISSH